MMKDLEADEQEPSLELRDPEGKQVFKIGSKGEIFWVVEGEFVQAKTDEELGKAMAIAIMQIAGMDYMRLVNVYLGESTGQFRGLLKKKVLELAGKSKTIKTAELVKALEEFKI